MTLKQLNSLASQLSIPIKHYKINANAISMSDSTNYLIVIKNEIENDERKEKVILAEELGHCVHNAWYNNFGDPHFNKENVRVAEGRATVFKIKHLVSVNELLNAFNIGKYEIIDLCEYFCLPENTMLEILRYYEDHPDVVEYRKMHQADWLE